MKKYLRPLSVVAVSVTLLALGVWFATLGAWWWLPAVMCWLTTLAGAYIVKEEMKYV